MATAQQTFSQSPASNSDAKASLSSTPDAYASLQAAASLESSELAAATSFWNPLGDMTASTASTVSTRPIAVSPSYASSSRVSHALASRTSHTETSHASAVVDHSTSKPLQRPDQPLSIGTKVGIGVGVTLAAVAILLGIGLLFWRRKKKAKHARERSRQDVEEVSRAEKDGTERYEAPDTRRLPEADGVSRAELEAGWVGSELPAKKQEG